MFDLDVAIANWKVSLGAGPCAPADADELESHLRDSIAHLSTVGLSLEESFLLSLHRLGRPEPLLVEYGKAYPERLWRDRVVWMISGLLAWNAISSLGEIFDVTVFVGTAKMPAMHSFFGAAGSSTYLRIATYLLSRCAVVMFAILIYRRVSRTHIRCRPYAWFLAALIAIIIGQFISQFEVNYFCNAYRIPAVHIEWLTAQICTGIALSLVAPLLFGILAIRLSRRDPNSAHC